MAKVSDAFARLNQGVLVQTFHDCTILRYGVYPRRVDISCSGRVGPGIIPRA